MLSNHSEWFHEMFESEALDPAVTIETDTGEVRVPIWREIRYLPDPRLVGGVLHFSAA